MAEECTHIPHEVLGTCKRCGVALTSAPANKPAAASAPSKPFVPATKRVADKLAGKKG